MAKQIISVKFGNLGFIPSITRKFIPTVYDKAFQAAQAGGMSHDESHEFATDQASRSKVIRPNIKPNTIANQANTPISPNWENSVEAFLCRD